MKKLNPLYSFEFNVILNESFTQIQNIQNFSSLISDKDRFFQLLEVLEKKLPEIEKKLGFSLPEKIEFYVVRAEKFKSFSLPITIEYSMLPQEMILFLVKEIIKSCCTTRFPDENKREQIINSFICLIVKEDILPTIQFEGILPMLNDESLRLDSTYVPIEVSFENKTLSKVVEDLYSDDS